MNYELQITNWLMHKQRFKVRSDFNHGMPGQARHDGIFGRWSMVYAKDKPAFKAILD